MKMYMIASIYKDNARIGFRTLDTDTNTKLDVLDSKIIAVLRSGVKIINLELKNNKIQGSNGDIKRYAKIVNGVLENKMSPLVILNQIDDIGYTVSDSNGTIKKLSTENTIQYATEFGIANGKVSSRDGKQFISAISGYYDIIHKETVAKPIVNKESIEQNSQSNCNNSKDDNDIVKETKQPVVKLGFTDEQAYVLKRYYSTSNINSNEANTEIEELNNAILGKTERSLFSKTPLLNEIIAKLETTPKIGMAFGNELGAKIISFLNSGLPLPKSLVTEICEYVANNMENFCKILFSDFADAISSIFSNNDDTFKKISNTYIRYMMLRELAGEFKGFDTEQDAIDKVLCKQYVYCYNYDFTELRALVGVYSILLDWSAVIEDQFINSGYQRFLDKAFRMALKYNDESDADKAEKIAVLCSTQFNSKFNIKDNSTDNKYAILAQSLWLEEDTQLETKCIYKSTPMKSVIQRNVKDNLNIGSIYRYLIQAINIGESLVIGRFIEFCSRQIKTVEENQRRKDALDLQRIQQEALKKQQERREQERKERERQEKERQERERQEKERQEKERQEREKQEKERQSQIKSLQNEQNSVGLPELQNINSSGENEIQKAIKSNSDLSIFDPVDLYKELKKQTNINKSDICFVISEDMISRKLLYRDMSKRQKYRLDEAISKMIKSLHGEGTKYKHKVDQSKKEQDSEVNNQYQLSDHPDISSKIDKLINMADSVEMQEVLKEEPNALKICYSILRYKKASDKQLKHIDNAIRIMDAQ